MEDCPNLKKKTVTKRFASAVGKEPMAQWQDTEELLRETIEDEPQDWYNIDPYPQTNSGE